MTYTVMPSDLSHIRYHEPDTVKAVLQNIALILATPKGSVPQYRDFGLDMAFVDKPEGVAKVLALAAVREAVEEFEPRAVFRSMTMVPDPSVPGRFVPSVEVEINV